MADAHRRIRSLATLTPPVPPLAPRRLALGCLIAALGLAGCATPIAQPEPNPAIYDAQADGEQQLAAALAEARRTEKRVLVNFGANWCSDSQKMYRLLQDNTRIAELLRTRYVLVLIDANNRTDTKVRRNHALAERLGNPFQHGIPVLLVLDADGRPLNSDPDERLVDSDHRHPRKVLRYLTKWASPGPR
jgi:thiol:disulfide interchange protein